mgnify:CR=1 FL=1
MNPRLADLPLPLSKFSLGAWAFAGGAMWGEQDEKNSLATIHAAMDAGVTMIDTAPGYGGGLSEEIVGRGIKGRRDQVLIANKVSAQPLNYETTISCCEEGLKRLQTDHVDLLQIHWRRDDTALDEVAAAMEKLRDDGKALTLGVCNFGPKSLSDLFQNADGWITNQLAYNLLWRANEFAITDACVSYDMGILCYSPIQQGLLTGRFANASEVPESRRRTRHFDSDSEQSRHGESGNEALTFATIDRIRKIADDLGESMADLSLAWLLHQRGVSSVIFGARSPEQVAANMKAEKLKLDEATLTALDKATYELKAALGPNADLWNAETRIV